MNDRTKRSQVHHVRVLGRSGAAGWGLLAELSCIDAEGKVNCVKCRTQVDLSVSSNGSGLRADWFGVIGLDAKLAQ